MHTVGGCAALGASGGCCFHHLIGVSSERCEETGGDSRPPDRGGGAAGRGRGGAGLGRWESDGLELMRNVGMILHVIHTLRARGITNVKVNMDWQHLLMNGTSKTRQPRTRLPLRFKTVGAGVRSAFRGDRGRTAISSPCRHRTGIEGRPFG
jgi:hypothetical protein